MRRTFLWVLAGVLFLFLLAIPTFLSSEAAQQVALNQGFSAEQIELGRQYSLERRLFFWSATILHMVLLMVLVANRHWLAERVRRWVRCWWLGTVLGMGLLIGLAEEVVNLPFGLARLEHLRAWGLTEQTWNDWLTQHLLGLGVFGGLQALVLVGFYVLLRYLPRTWWLWSALGTTLLSILGAWLLPIFISPLFNTFTPLRQTEWKDLEPRVQHLLAQAKVSVQDVLVMDASRQSGHTNAYFTGFGATRRIVLYDTLLKKHTPTEVESILAHELGHWLHNHIVKGILLAGVAALLGFFVLYRLLTWMQKRGDLKSAADPAGLPWIILFGVLGSWLALPVENGISRHFERQADAMSLELAKDPEVFIAAEQRLVRDNYSNLTAHPWAVFLFWTHPPAVERIQMAREWKGLTSRDP